MKTVARTFFFLLRLEMLRVWRHREMVLHPLLFAGVILLIFSFSFSSGDEVRSPLSGSGAAGFLWVTLMLTATLTTQQRIRLEQTTHWNQALWLSVLPPPWILIAKTLSTALVLGLIMACFSLLMVLFWHIQPAHWGIFCTSITLGILGISILCALFADSLRSGGAAAWLSLLTYPLAIPLLFSGVQVGQELLSGQPPDWETIYRWISFSAVFDGLSLLTALWLAGPLSSKE